MFICIKILICWAVFWQSLDFSIFVWNTFLLCKLFLSISFYKFQIPESKIKDILSLIIWQHSGKICKMVYFEITYNLQFCEYFSQMNCANIFTGSFLFQYIYKHLSSFSPKFFHTWKIKNYFSSENQRFTLRGIGMVLITFTKK